jgi:hypothetical protein
MFPAGGLYFSIFFCQSAEPFISQIYFNCLFGLVRGVHPVIQSAAMLNDLFG